MACFVRSQVAASRPSRSSSSGQQPDLVQFVERQREDEMVAIAERTCSLVAQVRELAHERGRLRADGLGSRPGLAALVAVQRLAQDLRDLVLVDLPAPEPPAMAREERAETSLGLDDAICQGAVALARLAGEPGQADASREARRRRRPRCRPRRAVRSGCDRRAPHPPAWMPRRAAARARPSTRRMRPNPPASGPGQGVELLLEVVYRRLHRLHRRTLDDPSAPPQARPCPATASRARRDARRDPRAPALQEAPDGRVQGKLGELAAPHDADVAHGGIA